MAAMGFDRDARKMIRQKFRRVVRNVIINRTWLMDNADQKMTLNVKQNVALFLRQKRKIGILSKAEKTLLRTPHELRTVADRKKLVHLFANLPCFSRFSPKIRARLVRIVAFMMLGPNRIVLRTGHQSQFLYFILSGEIQISKEVYDPVKNITYEKPLVVTSSGDIHGIAGMVQNTKRITTSRTITDVELLAVHYDDYMEVLHSSLEKELKEKDRCFEALGYFNKMAGKSLGFRLAVLKQYDPLESIYSEDKGPLTFVHFVVSGECMILQCLRMKVTSKKGKEKTFELVKIKKGERLVIQDLKGEELMAMARKNVAISQRKTKSSETQFLINREKENSRNETKYVLSAKELNAIEKNCGFRKSDTKIIEETKENVIENVEGSTTNIRKRSEGKRYFRGKKMPHKVLKMTEHDDDLDDWYCEERETGEEGDQERISYDDIESSSSKFSHNLPTNKTPSEVSIKDRFYENDVEEFDEDFEQEHEQEDEYEAEANYMYQPENRESRSKSLKFEDPDTKVENHFIDVGSLTFGGIFGLGELLEHRVIMARTTVQCILIPRFFLFEKANNPGEIWNRRRFYIECNIPSRQQLFENFLTTRKWQKFKNNLIERNLGDALKYNPTKVEDIPIMCRIVEPNDE